MKRLSVVTVAVLVVATVFCAVQALECGIDSSSSNKDLRQIADSCMKKKVEEKKKVTSDPEDEEDMKESSTEPYNGKKRSKRNDENSKNSDSTKSNDGSFKNGESNNSNSTAAEKDNCVVHCIFRQLGMVDGEGFPVHHRVLNALLNNARGRELRDFVQDTTDECFQLMEQGDHHDPCQYSVTLVNCLAERGKSNCADWPIGNLPFLSKKN